MLRVVMAVTATVGLTLPSFAEDVAIPPTSTPEQIEAFKDADDNSDGALTPPEFRTFIETMAEQGDSTARFINSFGIYSVAFSQVDRDGDGFARPFEISNATQAYESGEGEPEIGSSQDR